MDQSSHSGFESYRHLEEILKKINPGKILLVTGKTSYSSSGAESKLSPILEQYDVVHFNDHPVNCRIEDIDNGISVCRENQCDLVIGIGGGTSLDLAKAIAVLSTQKEKSSDFITGKAKPNARTIKLILIPTTAGSGSEATQFAVVYVNNVKHSLEDEALLPDFVILDPIFSAKLPASITAYTGMDALCQAIESFWSINSTDESKEYSRKAIRIILTHLVSCFQSPNKESREQMLLAANYAGQAINITRTTGPHAVSYPLTSLYRVPHGHAVALILPHFLEFNTDISEENVQDKRGSAFVKSTLEELFSLLGAKDANSAKSNFLDLMAQLKLPSTLQEASDVPIDVETILSFVSAERMHNNPKKASQADLRKIISKL